MSKSWESRMSLEAQKQGVALDILAAAWPITLNLTQLAVTRRYGRIEDEDADADGIDTALARLERLRQSRGAAQHKRLMARRA